MMPGNKKSKVSQPAAVEVRGARFAKPAKLGQPQVIKVPANLGQPRTRLLVWFLLGKQNLVLKGLLE